MKIFTIQSKIVDGKPATSSATVNLTIDEIVMVRTVLANKRPFDNEVQESVRTSIVEQFNTL